MPANSADQEPDRRAWKTATIDAPAHWNYPLPADCLDWALDAKDVNANTVVPISCSQALAPVRQALEKGRGFALVEGLPIEELSAPQAQAAYWALGHYLGRPTRQNIEGALLYDVRDTGQEVSQGARFSVTNAESTFHTDNAFNPQLPDIVGLLCLQTARRGGRSQLLSARTLYNELARYPDVLDTLSAPWHFDRRGQFDPGHPPVSQYPIFQHLGDDLTMRYMHYYIEVGHQRLGQPFSPAQRRALDVLEEQIRRPDLRVEFDLGPGQMLFTNNRWILHNRTAFDDYDQPDRRRHYIRLWLQRHQD
ncbi:MAG: TauD/TfdA family dioxygenase [Candidatus Latescibacteria bacterium]|nr:TauD/TfdA family dioxygenase [Candidatus Latescibacterota bacterium]